MTIVDGDLIEDSNRNRQLPALVSTVNKPKADVLAQRFLDINPDLKLKVVNTYLRDEKILEILKDQPYDYVVDAIDTLTPKIFLIYHALQLNLKVVSSMGAGGKIDPSCIKVADISKSYSCKLARILRKRLSKFGIKKVFRLCFHLKKLMKKPCAWRKDKTKNQQLEPFLICRLLLVVFLVV